MPNSEFGLEAIMFPDPPEISTDPSIRKTEEEVVQDIGKIAQYLTDLAQHHDGFKEALVRNFVSAVAKVPEINAVQIVSDVLKSQVVHLGLFESAGSRFVLDGPNRRIDLFDPAGTLRIRLGLIGGVPKLTVYPSFQAGVDLAEADLSDLVGRITGDQLDLSSVSTALQTTFDLSTLAGRITGTQIDAVSVATVIARVIQLNADRIVAGTISADRLTADVKNVENLYQNTPPFVPLITNKAISHNDLPSVSLTKNFKDFPLLEIAFHIDNGNRIDTFTLLYPSSLVIVKDPDIANLDHQVYFKKINERLVSQRLVFLANSSGENTPQMAIVRGNANNVLQFVISRSSASYSLIYVNGIYGAGGLIDEPFFKLEALSGAGNALPSGGENIEFHRPAGRRISPSSVSGGRGNYFRLCLYKYGEFVRATSWQTATTYSEVQIQNLNS